MTLSSSLPTARAPRSFKRRGQTMILGVVALLVLALIVFVTFNVTVAVQQKVKLQNYADAKAFSMAVAEARTLNYMAYTNRAIASAYVGMANVHAYMSEAAMMADLKLAGATIMAAIAGQETSQCLCCLGAPCCADHCYHAFEATTNSVAMFIDWVSGSMGNKVKELDGPATDTLGALNTHITTIHAAQTLAKTSIITLLTNGEMGQLKSQNMMKADRVTNDATLVRAANTLQWNKVFYDSETNKKRIMAEIANASRTDFAWSRKGTPGLALFPSPWIADNMKGSVWMGPDGNWAVVQLPNTQWTGSGRTAFTEDGFGGFGSFRADASTSNNSGRALSSFDWGTITGTWRHGVGAFTLPTGAPFLNSSIQSGENGNSHSAGFITDIFNNPHNGSDHNMDIDMSRFVEFDIGTDYPFNQPSVYAAVSTDARVNEYGRRGPWEVKKDQSGVVTMQGVGNTDGRLAIANNNTTKAFSKAMVYYHRVGDWADYPNLFNPFWRAKLEPLSQGEVATVLGSFDTDAAAVATGARGVNSSAVNIK
ncbi:MAG TPA: pilus assembly protein TadG-related protein [Myxococcaceae bacterium]|nr:pilus assembly protein TadG-related protein [Myxococcaceae bacterium]